MTDKKKIYYYTPTDKNLAKLIMGALPPNKTVARCFKQTDENNASIAAKFYYQEDDNWGVYDIIRVKTVGKWLEIPPVRVYLPLHKE